MISAGGGELGSLRPDHTESKSSMLDDNAYVKKSSPSPYKDSTKGTVNILSYIIQKFYAYWNLILKKVGFETTKKI